MADDDSADIDIVARTLDGEARGEGRQGMIAVACVIVNRAIIADAYVQAHGEDHPLFGDGSLSSVCQAPLQFSCWNENDPNLSVIKAVTVADPIFAQAVEIATQAENDELDDITSGATHYYAKGTPMPKWAVGETPCYLYGKHLFFNNIA
jgi:N-acetylmuramoyl-L-alanine amidase